MSPDPTNRTLSARSLQQPGSLLFAPLVPYFINVHRVVIVFVGIVSTSLVGCHHQVVVHMRCQESKNLPAKEKRISVSFLAQLTVPEADSLVVLGPQPFAEENCLVTGRADDMCVASHGSIANDGGNGAAAKGL